MAQGITHEQVGELTGSTFGQYHLGHLLGQGGMAAVYKARQTSIGRAVAVKVLPVHVSHDASFIQRFEQEVQIIASLQHPRILAVYDYGHEQNRPFIVMAYVAGGTLADRIAAAPLSLDETVRLTSQIAEALD